MAEHVIAGDLVDLEWSPDGEEATYEIIPGCKTVGIPEENPEYRDRTSLDSPGRAKEWGVGLTDTSEVTLSCFYSADLYEAAAAYKAARAPVFFRVKLPAVEGAATGDVFTYKAFVNPSIPSTDQDGDLMTDLKLRPTGLIDWERGANA
ncbi:hypothetical protein [Tritonibacter horizontis]|uniref:Phage major tail protein 2 n=1 Tax=Tritonibacter horizontis TaxID=1768241 RepID=A0A132BVN9_9RHOB|nr:hypothetical protein [Tritonibacter horizontis]KUP91800.1 hypothetical protein TRIHO_33310 [Tritonibacter horizontis]